jgi:hypothetical protein
MYTWLWFGRTLRLPFFVGPPPDPEIVGLRLCWLSDKSYINQGDSSRLNILMGLGGEAPWVLTCCMPSKKCQDYNERIYKLLCQPLTNLQRRFVSQRNPAECLYITPMQQIMILAHVNLWTCICPCTLEGYQKATGRVTDICQAVCWQTH